MEVLLRLAEHGALDVHQLERLTGASSGALTRAFRPFLPWYEPALERMRGPRLPLLHRRRISASGRAPYRYWLTRAAVQTMGACGVPTHPDHHAKHPTHEHHD